jgi:hypothetical protein
LQVKETAKKTRAAGLFIMWMDIGAGSWAVASEIVCALRYEATESADNKALIRRMLRTGRVRQVGEGDLNAANSKKLRRSFNIKPRSIILFETRGEETIIESATRVSMIERRANVSRNAMNRIVFGEETHGKP